MQSPKATSTRRSPRAATAGVLILSMLLLGCNGEKKDEITLQVGPEQVIRFPVESGFAHYYELPNGGDVLRIVLASYEVGCTDYISPGPGQVFVTVTLKVPANHTLEPGEFEWKGLSVEDAEEEEESPPPVVSPLPFVRLAEDARALPPGGVIKLREFHPERFGIVSGELAFRDAEAGQAASTALMGSFEVRLCHTDLDPGRRAAPGSQ